MITTYFKVKNRILTNLGDVKLIGLVDQDKFHVDFEDEEWQDLHKTMKLIRSDGQIIHIIEDMNNEYVLTQECYVEGLAQVGFFGTLNENEPEDMKIASTDYVNVYFSKHAYEAGESGIPINQPTPTQWDIIVGQLNEIKDDIREYTENISYADIKNKPQTWQEILGE